MFLPDQGPPVGGRISADGTYRLRAAAGRYRVGVTAFPEMSPGANPETTPPPPPLVPPKYNRPESSGLAFEVKPTDSNRFDLALK